MLGGAATGALAGLGMRSRWAMLLAPAAYLVALEAAVEASCFVGDLVGD